MLAETSSAVDAVRAPAAHRPEACLLTVKRLELPRSEMSCETMLLALATVVVPSSLNDQPDTEPLAAGAPHCTVECDLGVRAVAGARSASRPQFSQITETEVRRPARRQSRCAPGRGAARSGARASPGSLQFVRVPCGADSTQAPSEYTSPWTANATDENSR